MCEFLSFVVDKKGKIYASSLRSHEKIEELWELRPGNYREADWTTEDRSGLTVRVEDGEDESFYLSLIAGAFRTRTELIQHILLAKRWRGDKLDLSGCTIPEGLKLPAELGWLDLRGCTIPEGLKLPAKITGWLDLRGCTIPEGLKLPGGVRGIR